MVAWPRAMTDAAQERARPLAAVILAAPERPTAVFAHNDALALGLMEAMRERGLDAAAFLSAHDSHGFFAALGDLVVSGPTRTHGLMSGSPAIDAADDSAAPATDQRGRTRPSTPVCSTASRSSRSCFSISLRRLAVLCSARIIQRAP